MDLINIKQKIGEGGTNHSPDTLHRQTDGQGETNIHLYDIPNYIISPSETNL